MVKIRLARHGSKKRAYYHIVVADSERKRDGRFLEQVGTYNPALPDEKIRMNLDRVDHWLGVGAQPTDRARKLINAFRRLDGTNAEALEAAAAEAVAEEAPAAEAAAEASA